jgi:NADPH2:quinone reductase
MRAMRAESFNGYKELKLVDLPKPAVTDGKVLCEDRPSTF